MNSVPAELQDRLKRFGQEHVLAWWNELNTAERTGLVEQLRRVPFEELQRLYGERDKKGSLPAPERIVPLPWPDNAGMQENRRLAEQAFRAGEMAFLVVAGGQGTRLGFDHPKGMFKVGPVSNKSLFQIDAEKIAALGKRYGVRIPFLVMTSPATAPETEPYFREHGYFGLAPEDVFFFSQGTMPALDLATGKLLMEAKGQLFLSPNGHGGTLTALADTGLLDQLKKRGIRTIYYFQIDNPLVNLADLGFIGQHLAKKAQVSSKVIPKDDPLEKVGNFVLIDGRCTMIEYSDLPEDLARQRDDQGRLRLWAGSPAIHLFDVDFLGEVTRGGSLLPWHFARKKVPHINEAGQAVEPTKENALKFERFIFDVLPLAERWSVVTTTRRDEFEPLKNATGKESPATVRQAISTLAADWLEKAGVRVSRDVALEIDPRFALDVDELAAKVKSGVTISQPTVIDDSFS